MDIEKVYEFSAGKNDWNTIEVGLHDGRIVVRDEIGMLEFDDEDVDQLHNAIDQARRRLRENERRPTQSGDTAETEAAETDTAADADTEPAVEPTSADTEPADTGENEDDTEESDEPQSTGLGPQFPGSGPQ